MSRTKEHKEALDHEKERRKAGAELLLNAFFHHGQTVCQPRKSRYWACSASESKHDILQTAWKRYRLTKPCPAQKLNMAPF